MKKPEELNEWNFSDNHAEVNGYDLKYVPDLTRDNFNTLVDEHNNLVECFNALSEHIGFEITGE